MQIDIVTIFPKMFDGPFGESIIGKAQEKNIVEIQIHDLRNWAEGKWKRVDDTPFGGGGGMVMMIEPIDRALNELRKENSIVIATTAKGETFKQSTAKKLAEKLGKSNASGHIIIICGHYEGFDQRILDNLVDIQISIGNYVLTGGEIPAMVITDAIVRLLPSAVGNEETPKSDSFYADDKTKQYPIYTKPAEYKGMKVPDILVSGDHGKIKHWKNNNS